MYASDATYHRLARALKHPDVGREDLAVKYCGLQLGKDVTVVKKYYYICLLSNLAIPSKLIGSLAIS